MIRIAIAEEHKLLRWGLREALSQIPDLTVVGDAGTVDTTLSMLKATTPDVLLLDLELPDHGHDVLKQIREHEGGPMIIVLTGHMDPMRGVRALAGGAHGVLGKWAEPAELLDAIRTVHRGERVVPPAVDAMIAAGEKTPTAALTAREHEVMELLARGMTNREIAQHLHIGLKTVDTHRGHILKKLALRNNAELTRFAVKHGYITA